MTDEIWRSIAEATQYEVSNLGNVRNTVTKKLLRPNKANSVLLYSGGEAVRRGVSRLRAMAFDPSEAGETWRTCKDAYMYSVSSLGRVMNNKTGRVLKPNAKGQVILMDAGWRLCRSISKLVQAEFG